MLSRLRAGDELLEVNGRPLYGLKHFEVIRELKDTPKHVRLVCARVRPEFAHAHPHAQAAAAGALSSGSGPLNQSVTSGSRVPPPLSKSKSEQESSTSNSSSITVINGSSAAPATAAGQGQARGGPQGRGDSGVGQTGSTLAEHVPRKPSRTGTAQTPGAVSSGSNSKRPSETSSTAAATEQAHTQSSSSFLAASNKSRSLEPLNQLATWSSTPLVVELNKGDRGLGFSILDHKACICTSSAFDRLLRALLMR